MALTREEFNQRFRGRMLLFLAEAWSSRKAAPSELGILMDSHAVSLRQLLGEMWEAMAPEVELVPPGIRNGQTKERKVG